MKVQIPYKPTDIDIKWVKNITAVVSDHGVWTWPMNAMTYQFDKTGKTLTLTNPELLEQSYDNRVNHHRCSVVFKEAVGYTVLPEDKLSHGRPNTGK